MNTLFNLSPDGARIAYDQCGSGPAVILLHGGGGSRQDWREAGYVQRLQEHFTVIALDLRGHGESSLLTRSTDYTIDKLMQDIIGVADACGVECFTLWGMSYGGKVGRYLPARSERVSKIILMGTPLGLGVTGQLRQDAIDFCSHWPPIMQAQQAGTLDTASLSREDQDFIDNFNVPVMLGWVDAMLAWPAVEPTDLRCPTLWLVGSEDKHAMASVKEYEESLPGSMVDVHIFPGLNHDQVFSEIDKVFPLMLAFSLL